MFSVVSLRNLDLASRHFYDVCLGFWIQSIDFFLQANGSLNGCHDAAIGFDLFQAKDPVPAVLEPFGQHLVPSDLVLPQLQGNGLKVLGFVDVHRPFQTRKSGLPASVFLGRVVT